jgi:hypothetical protein
VATSAARMAMTVLNFIGKSQQLAVTLTKNAWLANETFG